MIHFHFLIFLIFFLPIFDGFKSWFNIENHFTYTARDLLDDRKHDTYIHNHFELWKEIPFPEYVRASLRYIFTNESDEYYEQESWLWDLYEECQQQKFVKGMVFILIQLAKWEYNPTLRRWKKALEYLSAAKHFSCGYAYKPLLLLYLDISEETWEIGRECDLSDQTLEYSFCEIDPRLDLELEEEEGYSWS